MGHTQARDEAQELMKELKEEFDEHKAAYMTEWFELAPLIHSLARWLRRFETIRPPPTCAFSTLFNLQSSTPRNLL